MLRNDTIEPKSHYIIKFNDGKELKIEADQNTVRDRHGVKLLRLFRDRKLGSEYVIDHVASWDIQSE